MWALLEMVLGGWVYLGRQMSARDTTASPAGEQLRATRNGGGWGCAPLGGHGGLGEVPQQALRQPHDRLVRPQAVDQQGPQRVVPVREVRLHGDPRGWPGSDPGDVRQGVSRRRGGGGQGVPGQPPGTKPNPHHIPEGGWDKVSVSEVG